LPEPIVEAVRNDGYDPGDCDISVTQLIGPPQIRKLRQLHEDEISEDASGRIWALLGQAVHIILERASKTATVEKRLFAEVNGYTISGQLDRVAYEPCKLTDYKVTSAWTFIGGLRPDWISQLNCYAFLCLANGILVDELEIVAIYRDWSQAQAKRRQDYPESQVARLPVSLWPEGFALGYIQGRLFMHFDLEMRPCTDEERWAKPEKWAVMKKGRKSALRVLGSKQEALLWATEKGHIDAATDVAGPHRWKSGYYLQERPREYPRCERYCAVSSFCDQWAAICSANEELS